MSPGPLFLGDVDAQGVPPFLRSQRKAVAQPVSSLASAHQRRIGQNPLIPAPTSARLISDKREVGSSNLPRPTF